VTLQPQYNLLMRDIELEVVPACRDAGIGLLPWSPLAGGWLSGSTSATSSRRRDAAWRNPKRGGEAFVPRNAQDRTWQVIGALETVAKARGVSLAEVALAWCVAKPAVTLGDPWRADHRAIGAESHGGWANPQRRRDGHAGRRERATRDGLSYGGGGTRQRMRRSRAAAVDAGLCQPRGLLCAARNRLCQDDQHRLRRRSGTASPLGCST